MCQNCICGQGTPLGELNSTSPDLLAGFGSRIGVGGEVGKGRAGWEGKEGEGMEGREVEGIREARGEKGKWRSNRPKHKFWLRHCSQRQLCWTV